jgi:hypothetical protein
MAMPDVENLISQLERAKRFAAAMTNETERSRFETMAAEFQRELDRVEDHPVFKSASARR